MITLFGRLLPVFFLPAMLVQPQFVTADEQGFKPPPPIEPASERRFDVGQWQPFAFGTDYDRRTFSISPDGRHLLGMNEANWRLKIVDLQSGEHLADFGEAGETFRSVAVSPDGQHLVSVGYQSLDLYDLPRRKHLRSLDEDVATDSFEAAAFLTPKRLAVVVRDALCVWDIGTGEELLRYNLPPKEKTDIVSPKLAAAPGGAVMAVIVDHRVLLIEAATGQLRAEVARLPHDVRTRRHLHAASCLAFSQSGRLLAVGCADAIRLYDVVTNKELPPLTAHHGGIWALHFTPDGKFLMSLGKDHRLLTWSLAEISREFQPSADAPPMEAVINAINLDDAWQTYAAMQTAASDPEASVATIRQRLKAVMPLDSDRVKELLAGFTDKNINTRKAAARKIGNSIDQVMAALPEHGEMRRSMQWRLPSESQLRDVQLAWFLGELKTPAAKELLTDLAGGYENAPLTKAAKAALAQKTSSAAIDFSSPQELRAAFADRDAERAFAAMRHVATHWERKSGLVREELLALDAVPDPAGDAGTVRDLIEQLDAENFKDRELAAQRLMELGKSVEPELQAALAGASSVEVKRRLEGILPKLRERSVTEAELLARRLTEAAVLVGSPDAHELLEEVVSAIKRRWLQKEIAELRSLPLDSDRAP